MIKEGERESVKLVDSSTEWMEVCTVKNGTSQREREREINECETPLAE